MLWCYKEEGNEDAIYIEPAEIQLVSVKGDNVLITFKNGTQNKLHKNNPHVQKFLNDIRIFFCITPERWSERRRKERIMMSMNH